MNRSDTAKQGTLGEKLAPKVRPNSKKWLFSVFLPIVILALASSSYKTNIIDADQFAIIVLVSLFSGPILFKAFSTTVFSPNHFLFRFDRQGFMPMLKLSDKTAIFDGNNIYHFGLESGFGASVLENILLSLRNEGYRIICFFDANIYYTLRENGAFEQGRERFSIELLKRIFKLKDFEIYVVPKGRQADDFIVESLSHLPVSFAVTNDRFRDFTARYDFLSKNNNWRKGITIKDGELLLYQHKLKQPITATR